MVYLVEIQELLRHVISHFKVLCLEDHYLLVKFGLLKLFEKLEDVLSLALKYISFLEGVYYLVLIDEKLLEGSVICLQKDILALNLDKDGLLSSRGRRTHLLRNGKGLHVRWWYLLKLDVVLLLHFQIL